MCAIKVGKRRGVGWAALGEEGYRASSPKPNSATSVRVCSRNSRHRQKGAERERRKQKLISNRRRRLNQMSSGLSKVLKERMTQRESGRRRGRAVVVGFVWLPGKRTDQDGERTMNFRCGGRTTSHAEEEKASLVCKIHRRRRITTADEGRGGERVW
jgi:hypothetical protein